MLAEPLAPLEVLPINSTLSNVTIPRFDENRNRAAYLKADRMEILSDGPEKNGKQPILVDCTGITLRILDRKGSDSLDVDMRRAKYRLGPGILKVEEQILAKSPRFQIAGEGGVFHLDSRRGFIFGPLQSIIRNEQPQASNTMNIPTLWTLSSILILAEPRPLKLNNDELRALDRQTNPTAYQFHQRARQVEPTVAQATESSQRASELLADFAQTVEDQGLTTLIQNQPDQPTPAPNNETIENPALKISCDGGAFFDGRENLLVFLRNVIVNEARFKLQARNELKVFFLASETEAKPENEGPEEEPQEDLPNIQITDVKSLAGTGGIEITGRDKNGNPFLATADQVTYDQKTEKLILRGGKPFCKFTRDQRQFALEAEDNSAYIQVDLSDDAIQVDTSPTGWTFAGDGLRNN